MAGDPDGFLQARPCSSRVTELKCRRFLLAWLVAGQPLSIRKKFMIVVLMLMMFDGGLVMFPLYVPPQCPPGSSRVTEFNSPADYSVRKLGLI